MAYMYRVDMISHDWILLYLRGSSSIPCAATSSLLNHTSVKIITLPCQPKDWLFLSDSKLPAWKKHFCLQILYVTKKEFFYYK